MNKVFIIAELSANHNGSKTIAIDTIKAAKRAGADAIKLQTYTPDTLTLNCDRDDFLIKGGTLWDGKTLYELYSEAYTPWEWHEELFNVAKQEGLVCFSTPFDLTSVDFLEGLDNPIYKIASFEISDIPLIEYAASKGKPMIISTGIANYDDIKLAIDTCHKVGNRDITLLKCTSAYPAPYEEANLIMMQQYAKDFDVKIGLSDHTLGITLPIVATALGATVIEKHFILDKSIGGPDAAFSLNEQEFTEMVNAVRIAEKTIGQISYDLTEKQIKSQQFARSIYVAQDIKEGETFTKDNLRSVRPGFGGHPKNLHKFLGKKAMRSFTMGDRFNDVQTNEL